MFVDLTLFDEREAKDETITLRLTKKQKERIRSMARDRHQSTSKFILALIKQENERQINADILDLFDDGMPF